MSIDRSLESNRVAAGRPVSRRVGVKGLAVAAAGLVLLLSGCVAYERDSHYHGRPGWGPRYNHFDGHHHRDGRYDGWRR